MGLTVCTEMPAVVFELMQLYPQTAQRRPAVEYIPLPYGPPERRKGGSRGVNRPWHRSTQRPRTRQPNGDRPTTDELLDLLRQERADFRNYQRRVADERAADARARPGPVLEPLFPLLDDLGRAFAEVPEPISRTTRGPGASRCCAPGSRRRSPGSGSSRSGRRGRAVRPGPPRGARLRTRPDGRRPGVAP